MNQENTSFEKQKKLIARRNALKLFFVRFPDEDPIFLENLSTKQYEELFDLLLLGKNLEEIKKAIRTYEQLCTCIINTIFINRSCHKIT